MRLTPALHPPLVREVTRFPLIGAVTVPIWYQLARIHDDVQTSAMLAAGAGAALLGFAFDDPAQPTLNACALGRTERRWSRMLLVATILASCWTVVVIAVLARGAELGPVSDRLPEAIAAGALASAFAAVGLRNGVAKPGFGAAVLAVLGMAVSTGMSFWSSQLRWLPQVTNPDHATRWWFMAGIAATAAGWWARDPAARPLGARSGRSDANRSATGTRQARLNSIRRWKAGTGVTHQGTSFVSPSKTQQWAPTRRYARDDPRRPDIDTVRRRS